MKYIKERKNIFPCLICQKDIQVYCQIRIEDYGHGENSEQATYSVEKEEPLEGAKRVRYSDEFGLEPEGGFICRECDETKKEIPIKQHKCITKDSFSSFPLQYRLCPYCGEKINKENSPCNV